MTHFSSPGLVVTICSVYGWFHVFILHGLKGSTGIRECFVVILIVNKYHDCLKRLFKVIVKEIFYKGLYI